MPTVEFSIRLDGKSEGCVKVFLKDEQSLKEARGKSLQQFAAASRRMFSAARSSLVFCRSYCCSSSRAARSGGFSQALLSHCARSDRILGAPMGRLLYHRCCRVTCLSYCICEWRWMRVRLSEDLCHRILKCNNFCCCRADAHHLLSSWFGLDCED